MVTVYLPSDIGISGKYMQQTRNALPVKKAELTALMIAHQQHVQNDVDHSDMSSGQEPKVSERCKIKPQGAWSGSIHRHIMQIRLLHSECFIW